MKLTSSDLVQILSVLLILVGLALVVIELRQSRDVAEAQLLSDSLAIGVGINTGILGENAATVLSKACTAPEELTGADAEVLTALYRARLQTLMRVKSIEEHTGLAATWDFRTFARGTASGILGTPFGRYFWSNERRWVSAFPELVSIFDDTLEEVERERGSSDCLWDNHADYMPQ